MKNIILCVDDESFFLNALRTLLIESLEGNHVIEIAESGEEALEVCKEIVEDGRHLSLIISDFIMPGMNGDELLVRLHALSPNSIKVMLTGQSNVQGIKRAINEANLYRFLEKPFNSADMILTVKSALLAYQRDRELEIRNEELERINSHLEQLVKERTVELSEKNKELEKLSVTDRLTGLFNRLKLDQVLEDELQRSQYGTNAFSVILLDIDKFKSVNDTYGHPVGDQVLVEVANLINICSREIDIKGRWGGEEFIIICRGTNFEIAIALAERIRVKENGRNRVEVEA
jgi:diguanylate cyclase (GGDEF)-like protein